MKQVAEKVKKYEKWQAFKKRRARKTKAKSEDLTEKLETQPSESGPLIGPC